MKYKIIGILGVVALLIFCVIFVVENKRNKNIIIPTEILKKSEIIQNKKSFDNGNIRIESSTSTIVDKFTPTPHLFLDWSEFEQYVFPVQSFNHDQKALDFNKDGLDEHIVYYVEKITLFGETKDKYRMKVYRWDDNAESWIVDHEDEGTEGSLYFDTAEYFVPFDLDNDAVSEAFITKRVDGTGNYRKHYILKWNGTKVSNVFLPNETKTLQNLRDANILQDGEVFGVLHLLEGDQHNSGSIAICKKDDTWCQFRNSAANPVAEVTFTLRYTKENTWKFGPFIRKDY